MTRRCRQMAVAALLVLGASLAQAGGVVVIAHANVRKLDVQTVQRIYTGKAIEVEGVPVQPANLRPGQPLRQRFLSDYLQQPEDAYAGYWTVRRYIGKGAPPREFATVAEVLAFVQATPGAVAYLDEADVPPATNVVLRK